MRRKKKRQEAFISLNIIYYSPVQSFENASSRLCSHLVHQQILPSKFVPNFATSHYPYCHHSGPSQHCLYSNYFSSSPMLSQCYHSLSFVHTATTVTLLGQIMPFLKILTFLPIFMELFGF